MAFSNTISFSFTKLLLTSSVVLLATMGNISCSKEQESKTSDGIQKKHKTSAQCTFSYTDTTSRFKWTAYKFTSKVGVSGTFQEITATTKTQNPSPTPEEALTGLSFNIATQSVESGLPLRDGRIAKSFFGTLRNTENIQATIKSFAKNNPVLSVTMNGITLDVPFTYELNGDHQDSVSITATVDMNQFQGQNAIAALNEVCKGGHTGEDGKSVLWPDVDLVWTTVLTSTCP